MKAINQQQRIALHNEVSRIVNEYVVNAGAGVCKKLDQFFADHSKPEIWAATDAKANGVEGYQSKLYSNIRAFWLVRDQEPVAWREVVDAGQGWNRAYEAIAPVVKAIKQDLKAAALDTKAREVAETLTATVKDDNERKAKAADIVGEYKANMLAKEQAREQQKNTPAGIAARIVAALLEKYDGTVVEEVISLIPKTYRAALKSAGKEANAKGKAPAKPKAARAEVAKAAKQEAGIGMIEPPAKPDALAALAEHFNERKAA